MTRTAASFGALLLAGAACISLPAAAQTETATAAQSRAEKLAIDLVGRMTPDEKIDQLLNTAPAIPRLGIPAYNWWTESLHGALGSLPTTNFPEPIGLAATFDAPLVKDVAGAISSEVRGLHALARQTGRMGRIGTGLDTWSPNINIFRDPRWGRGQETYGEDPFLTARMGVAFVTGMQGPNPDLPAVIATPKHFAVHSGPESTRHSANVFVSRHDLEDTYLPAFRAAIVEGKAGSVMCAYNRIDGQPACASDELLKEHLRGAWGFTGYVVSDCDAVKDISDNHHYAPDPAAAVAAALRAGVDNECHTATLSDTAGLGDRYREALKRGLISEGDIDQALVRLFAARYRNGDLSGVRKPEGNPAAVGAPEHGALALGAAEKSLVLLRNDGILPLRQGLRIAVVGPLGDATRVLRGNYSSPLSAPPISVVEGLRRAMPGTQIEYVPFGETFTDGDPVPTAALRAPDGRPGLLARYYNVLGTPPARFAPGAFVEYVRSARFADTPVATRVETGVDGRSLDLAQVSDHHRVVWTGFLVPPETGSYRLGLSGFMSGVLKFQGQPFVDLKDAPWGSLPTMKTVRLEKGRRYPIEITGDAHTGTTGVGLVWKRVSTAPERDLKAAAAKADVLVAVVGLTSDLEAEESPVQIPGFKGGDKTTLDIPPDQQALLEQAKATGKPIVLVAMNGSPINLAWAKDNASAIVEAWYPGQSGGLAIANVLSGKTNPSGRLPLTFYRSVDQLPPFGDYSMAGRTYRYFDGTPVYPFGYGLSYTRFAYAPLEVTPAAGGAAKGIRVTSTVRNTGNRAGDEIAQLYLDFPEDPGAPRIALRGFQRVTLKPGEARAIRFDLSPRDLSAVSADGVRKVLAGAYRVTVGSGQPGTGVPGESAGFTVREPATLPK
ncbi:MAG: glycoside hydrolase family 3 C-terminal domain-containing protein [Sphingomonas sp.]|uniref:glycoside hydrolase family 3 C-terminal domain-containing protein n=1 Tax=Sphingomonas sp. TaxID=28214 RepID=UPI001B02561E|nr:glycoside hydrolase family 3 C-terminal domain-containing protein [Sphingomonas sp.]MBO9624393.1 glycoside hydrolase family 3 C-terminal domain-containing protein [Sphingomonas sp.]